MICECGMAFDIIEDFYEKTDVSTHDVTLATTIVAVPLMAGNFYAFFALLCAVQVTIGVVMLFLICFIKNQQQ